MNHTIDDILDNVSFSPTSATVRGGEIKEDHLYLITEKDEYKIPWSDIRLIFLGNIIESVTVVENANKGSTPTQKFMSGIAGGSGQQSMGAGKKMDQTGYYLGYVFVKGYDWCFRFDTIGTNFRQLLGPDAGYSGVINYNIAFKKIISLALSSLLDPSAEKFAEQGKNWIATYSSREEALSKARMLFRKKCCSENHEQIIKLPSTAVSENSDDDGEEIISFDLT
jgi:hypothetical protein